MIDGLTFIFEKLNLTIFINTPSALFIFSFISFFLIHSRFFVERVKLQFDSYDFHQVLLVDSTFVLKNH